MKPQLIAMLFCLSAPTYAHDVNEQLHEAYVHGVKEGSVRALIRLRKGLLEHCLDTPDKPIKLGDGVTLSCNMNM